MKNFTIYKSMGEAAKGMELWCVEFSVKGQRNFRRSGVANTLDGAEKAKERFLKKGYAYIKRYNSSL